MPSTKPAGSTALGNRALIISPGLSPSLLELEDNLSPSVALSNTPSDHVAGTLPGLTTPLPPPLDLPALAQLFFALADALAAVKVKKEESPISLLPLSHEPIRLRRVKKEIRHRQSLSYLSLSPPPRPRRRAAVRPLVLPRVVRPLHSHHHRLRPLSSLRTPSRR